MPVLKQCSYTYTEGGQWQGQCTRPALSLGFCEAHEQNSFYRPPAPPMQTKETQQSISDWAVVTFGPTGSNLRIALRMNNEMAELLAKLAVNDNDEEAIVEAADLLIVSMRLFERFGANFWEVVETKMAINRAREWKKDGTGCGQHV